MESKASSRQILATTMPATPRRQEISRSRVQSSVLKAAGVGRRAFRIAILAVLIFSCADGRSEPADWQQLGVVDIHAHLGSYGSFDLRLETLLGNLERWHVRLALVSNLDGSSAQPTLALGMEEANRRTLEIVRRHPDRLRGLLWANPTGGGAGDLEPFVDATLDETDGSGRVFVGLKLHPDFDRYLADDPRVDPFLELCRRRRLVVFIHSGPGGGPSATQRIYAAARRHPEVPVVLYHMGSEGGHEAAIAAVEQSLESRDARLYLGSSRAPGRTILEAVRRVGAERVLFGSDATVYGARHYERYAEVVGALMHHLSARELDLVMGGNALRLTGLAPAIRDR